jgi:hypothetical protein
MTPISKLDLKSLVVPVALMLLVSIPIEIAHFRRLKLHT